MIFSILFINYHSTLFCWLLLLFWQQKQYVFKGQTNSASVTYLECIMVILKIKHGFSCQHQYFKIMNRRTFFIWFFITSDLSFVILELKRWKRSKKSFFNIFLKIYVKCFTSSKCFVTLYRPTLKQRVLKNYSPWKTWNFWWTTTPS